MVFCPIQYYRMLDNTWCNSDIFEEMVGIKPLQHHDDKVHAIRRSLPRCDWAFHDYGRVPTAYLLPKRKKQFSAGRPILSFAGCFARKLFLATAFLLHQLVAVAFPRSLQHHDVWQLTAIQRFFRDNESTTHFLIYNQDLEGFFTSIPDERFHSAWLVLNDRYLAANPGHAPWISVNVTERQSHLRLFRGHRRRAPLHEHRVWLEDMPTILRTILSLRYFVIGARMFAQRRGSPMGNPASPAMCLLVVAAVEESWSHTYAEMLHNNKQLWFSCRYVDNQLTMLAAPLATTPPFRAFLAKEFYIDTITLADEPGNDFLGFSINLNTRSIRYKPPDSPSQFLHPASASPTHDGDPQLFGLAEASCQTACVSPT